MKLISTHLDNVHSDIRGPLFDMANEMIKSGDKVLKLNTGNPGNFGFKMPESIKHAIENNFEKAVPYCDVKGMIEARTAIKNYDTEHGIKNLSVDDIFIGNGVSELAQMIATCIGDTGCEILMPSPNYSLWANVFYISNATPIFYTCDENQDWMPDIDDIKKKINKNTKALVLINPNNPTGAVYSKQFLEEIVQICISHDIVIISDEIYDRLCMENVIHYKTASFDSALKVITLNGLSKSHLICGFRCGWLSLSGPSSFKNEMRDALQKLAAMRLCGNALTQLVIPVALDDTESTKQMFKKGGRLYEQSIAVWKCLDEIDGITYVKNKAAFYLFPKFDKNKFGVLSDKQFMQDILINCKVLMIPGSGFAVPTNDHFRIVMLPTVSELEVAFTKIKNYLATYNKNINV